MIRRPTLHSYAVLIVGLMTLLSAGPASLQGIAQTSVHNPDPTLHGDAAHPATTRAWVDTKLYFGLGPADDATRGVSEAQWREFLDKEVTPRFPSGLSVMEVYGQWQSKGSSAVERIRSKVLVIDYPPTAENTARVEAIRSAWKKMTGDQSVLRVTQPADLSF